MSQTFQYLTDGHGDRTAIVLSSGTTKGSSGIWTILQSWPNVVANRHLPRRMPKMAYAATAPWLVAAARAITAKAMEAGA